MSRNKAGRTKMQPKNKGPTVRAGPPRIRAAGLDSAALAHAKLIADPCNAPLAHPVYPGGDAGYLVRVDSFLTYGGTGSAINGVLHYTPGYMNASGTELLVMQSTLPNNPVALSASSSAPGKTFLSTNSQGIRCVAACVKVSYPGVESNRSGRLHFGHTNAGVLDLADTPDIDGTAPLLPHYSRTPTDNIEIMWKPGEADAEFNDPNATADAAIRDRKSSITIVWAGIPQGVGLVFHFTAVYEWTPRAGFGLSGNQMGKAISNNSWDQVLDFLIKRGFKFVNSPAGFNMLGAAATSAISAVFGRMPTYPMTRNNRIAY